MEFIKTEKTHIWKPPVQLSDCSDEYLKNCPIDYQLLENPFSSKGEEFDPEKEKKLWQSLGIVRLEPDSHEEETLTSENPFYASSVPALHSVRELKRLRRAERKSKLSKWYNLPRPDLTDEDRDDIELVRLRRALTSDTHVRRSDTKAAYFQRGTIVDDPGSYYDRIPKKQRGKTIVEELLSNAEMIKKQRQRYAKIVRDLAEKRAALRRQQQQRLKKQKNKSGRQQSTVVVPT